MRSIVLEMENGNYVLHHDEKKLVSYFLEIRNIYLNGCILRHFSQREELPFYVFAKSLDGV